MATAAISITGTFVLTGLAMSSAERNGAASRAELAQQLTKERKQHERIETQFNRRLGHMRVHVVLSAPTEHLARIAVCESGGNTRALSPGGTYRGKYQFDPRTWRGVGGVGDPADAPEPEQDYRAWKLYLAQGAKPWPYCGRR
jgi:hypothetical protein